MLIQHCARGRDFLLSNSTFLLGIINELTKCENICRLKEVAVRFSQFNGCKHIVFGFPSLWQNEINSITVLNTSYPEEWVDIYIAKGFWRVDPVVKALAMHGGTWCWSETYKRYPPTKEFISMANDFGLHDGYACRVGSLLDNNWSIVSLSKEEKYKTDETLILLNFIVPHLHATLLSLLRKHKRDNFRLTKREIEVLKWMQHGKTSWEISVILRVAEATVNFHIQNIKDKLKVTSRSQAVAHAIHYGIITLSETPSCAPIPESDLKIAG